MFKHPASIDAGTSDIPLIPLQYQFDPPNLRKTLSLIIKRHFLSFNDRVSPTMKQKVTENKPVWI